MNQIINTSVSDFRLIFRDASLRIFLIMPIAAIFFVISLLPYLVIKYEAVTPYISYIVMAYTLQTSTMFGFIYCMVLIDEKDTGVNKIYGVLPITKIELITYRLIFPFLFSFGITFVMLKVQPFFIFPGLYNTLLSLLTGLIGPILAIVVTNYSKNKMQGLAIYKGINGLLSLPLLAFFIPEKFAFLFGLIPSHWIFQEINNFITGQGLYINMGIGFLLSFLMLALLIRQFTVRHFV